MARVGRVWRSRYRIALVVAAGTLAMVITLLVLPKAQAIVATVSTALLAGADVANVVLRASTEARRTPDEAGTQTESWTSPHRSAP